MTPFWPHIWLLLVTSFHVYGQYIPQILSPIQPQPTSPSLEYGAQTNSQPYAPSYDVPTTTEEEHENWDYAFKYDVRDEHGSMHSRTESRTGEKLTGSYVVRLPDGRTQVVNYQADRSGFSANVDYEPSGRDQPSPRAPAVRFPSTDNLRTSVYGSRI